MKKKSDTNYESEYIQTLKVYFMNSSTARIIKNVCHFGTEGGLLRIITTTDGTQYYPAINVFNIRVLERKPNPKA